MVDDYPDLPPIDTADAAEVLGVEEESEELEGVPKDAIVDAQDEEEQQSAVDAGDREQQERTKALATASRRSTAKSGKRPTSGRRSLLAKVEARRRREGSADGSRNGSASDRSRATTPASRVPAAADSPLSDSSSPATRRQRAAAAALQRSREAETPRPPSPLETTGKFKMRSCV